MTETKAQLHRRRVLQAIGGSSLLAIAGCTGGSDGTTDEDDEDDENAGDTEDGESDEDNVEDFQEDQDEQDSEFHTVEFQIVNGEEEAEGEPMSDVRVILYDEGDAINSEENIRSPYTDENGMTEVEARDGVEYKFDVSDSKYEWYTSTVVESSASSVFTRKENGWYLRTYGDVEAVLEAVQLTHEDDVVSP